MKKVTIIALHLGFGGIEKYISNLCKMLEKDYSVNIICVYKFDDKPSFDFSKKINIKYLVEGNPRGKSLKKYLISFKIISFIKEINNRIKLLINSRRLLKEELSKLNCDYVITTRAKHNKMVSKYVKNESIVKLATEHNHHQDNNNYINKLKVSLSGFDYLVLPSKNLYNYYKKLFDIKCVYIQTHIDNINNEYTDFNNKNIISVGRFSEEKGFVDLIEVFNIVHSKDKDIKLFLLGDGHLSNKIKEKVNELKLNDYVVIPGFIIDKNQKKYYMDSSIYVMTSYTEAFGLVLIEAMSYGLPCIAFDCASGPKELVTKERGILIKNRDKEKMADEIIKLINNKKELKRLQKTINIEEYSENYVKEKWFDLLKKS